MSELFVDRPARLFRAGEYPDKQFVAGEADLDAIVAATTGEVPLDLHHADTDETLPMGGLVPGSLRRDGEWLLGTMRLPSAIDASLRHRGLSVVIDRASRALRKVTVTPHPRVPGAAFAGEPADGGDLVLFDGGTLMPNEVKEQTSAAGGEPASGEEEPLTASKAEGVFKGLLAKLFGGGETEAPAAAPAFSQAQFDDAVKAAVAEQVKAAVEPLQTELTALRTQTATFSADRVQQRIAHEVSVNRVAPAMAELLVPFACGATEVAFSETVDGKEAEVKLGFAQAAEKALGLLGGTLPAGGQFSRPAERDGGSPAEFDQRVGAEVTRRAAALRAEGKEPNVALLQDAVLAEFSAAEVK